MCMNAYSEHQHNTDIQIPFQSTVLLQLYCVNVANAQMFPNSLTSFHIYSTFNCSMDNITAVKFVYKKHAVIPLSCLSLLMHLSFH